MVSSINLGNFFTSGGKTVFGGSASGLDTEGLIEELTTAKRLPAVQYEEKIESNNAKVEAYNEMKDILTRFQDAANFLRNPPGVQNQSSNIFEYRSAVLTSNDGSDPESYIEVATEPGAEVGNHKITVTQEALSTIQVSDDIIVADTTTPVVTAAPTANRFTAGTLTIKGTDSITLDAGDTLQDIVAKVNAITDDTGVTASAIESSSGVFKLVFRAQDTGLANDFDVQAIGSNTGPGNVLENISFADTQSAQDAIFTVDGVTVTRSDNTVDDVVDHLTFTIKRATGGTELTTSVAADTDLVEQGILNFVDAYNEFRLFTSRQTQTADDGTAAEDATLLSDPTLKTVVNNVASEMSAIVDGIASGDADKLADLGITFTDFPGDDENPFTRNILTVDSDQLRSAITNDIDEVRRVFEFDMVSDSSNLTVFSRTNALNVSEVTLNIDVTNDIYTADYIDSDGNPQNIELDYNELGGGTAVTLTGKEDTVLEGLKLIYTGGDDTVNVTLSQGIGDRVYNFIDSMLDDDTGAIAVSLESLSDRNDQLQEDIDRIDELVETYRLQMLDKFARLEQAIANVNTLLQSLELQQQFATS